MTAGTVLVIGLASAAAFLLTLRFSSKRVTREVQKVAERIDQLKSDVGVEVAECAAAAVQRAVREATDQRIREMIQEIKEINDDVVNRATETVQKIQKALQEAIKQKLEEMTREVEKFDSETANHVVETLRKALEEVTDREIMEIAQRMRGINDDATERITEIVQKSQKAIQETAIQKVKELAQEIKEFDIEIERRTAETIQRAQKTLQEIIFQSVRELTQDVKRSDAETRELVNERVQEIRKVMQEIVTQGIKEISQEIKEMVREIKKTIEETTQIDLRAEMPREFRVKEGNTALDFIYSHKPLEKFISEGYKEVPLTELSNIVGSSFLMTFLKQNEKNMRNSLTANLLTNVPSIIANSYILAEVLPREGVYVLSRPLRPGEVLFRYKDGSASSFLRKPDGSIGEHIGFLEKNRLRTAIVLNSLWVIGNVVFSTINLYNISKSLDRIERGIEAILKKMYSEKLARLRTLMERFEDLYSMSSYHINHLAEVNEYQKELIESYHYHLLEIGRNKEIYVRSRFTKDRIKDILSDLTNSALLEDSICVFESLRLLKRVELLKLKIISSLGDAHVFQEEFSQTLRKLMDEEKFKKARELFEVANQNVLSVARRVRKEACLHTEEAENLEKDLMDRFSRIEEIVKETGYEVAKAKEAAERFINLIQRPVNYVFAIKDGTVRVLAKIEED